MKKKVCGLFLLLAFSVNIFAENIYGSTMMYLKHTKTYQEFVDAAGTWESTIAYSNPRKFNKLSTNVYNAIVRELSRRDLSVGDLFLFGCYIGPGVGYDILIRIGKVNNDGSCGHIDWCGWIRDLAE